MPSSYTTSVVSFSFGSRSLGMTSHGTILGKNCLDLGRENMPEFRTSRQASPACWICARTTVVRLRLEIPRFWNSKGLLQTISYHLLMLGTNQILRGKGSKGWFYISTFAAGGCAQPWYTWQIWAVIFGCSESGAVKYSTLLLAFLMTRWSIGGGAQKKQECMGRPISRAGRSNEMLSQGKGSDEQQGNRTCSSKQGYELHASSLASWIYIVWTDMADIGR